MTYEAWLKLSDEEQENVPEEELPEIPLEQLENKLIYSKMMRQDGVLGWKIIQKVPKGENTRWFPVYKSKMIGSQEIWYKFDPIWGTYSMNLVGVEPSMTQEPIGRYGMSWIGFMEREYPHLVELMRLHNKFLTVARKVNETAFAYKELLDRQYEQMNPRPDDFEECIAWERTREFYTDGTVMRERVLVPHTEDYL